MVFCSQLVHDHAPVLCVYIFIFYILVPLYLYLFIHIKASFLISYKDSSIVSI